MKLLRYKTNILMMTGIAVMTALCAASISKPVAFARERKARETLVKARLTAIRTAEEDYRAKHGTYCRSIDRLAKEMRLPAATRLIPGTDGKKWTIRIAVMPGSGGHTIQLMETGATYSEYLQGLNSSEIERITDIAEQNNRYPGLKIGDTVTPNNNAGNWE